MPIEGDIVEDVVVDAGEPAESKATNPITDPQPEEVKEPEVKDEKPEEPPVPKGVQKRIDRAVRQKYEAEARAKMLEERLSYLEQQSRQSPAAQQNAIDNSEPKIENFDNFDEYVAAKAEFIASRKIEETLSAREKQQMAAREATDRQKTVESWTRRVAEATAEMPDFEEVIASSDVPMTDLMQQAIMESDVGTKLAYHLANHPDEAIKIAQMPPLRAVAALGRLEERLSTPAAKTVSAAPPPIKPVGGARATAAKDPGRMSDAEYAEWRRKARAA